MKRASIRLLQLLTLPLAPHLQRRAAGCRAAGLLLVVLLPAAAAMAQEPDVPAPIFQEQAALAVRIEAPLSDIFRSRGDDAEYFPARLTYADAQGAEISTALRIKTRGNFRNRENVCRFPPLMFNFTEEDAAGTLFAGENRLKLVTHCQPRARYTQYVLLEYLAYRIFNLLTDTSIRVRLLDIVYVDPASGDTLAAEPGFLLEDIERLGERLQLHEVSLMHIDRKWYDARHEVLVSLFQYLIGNTDWSIVIGDPGEPCCHNAYALQGGDTTLIPLPYDFDVTGFVDPRYGLAPRQLGIYRLTQRLYRGACPAPEHLQQALDLFIARQQGIRLLVQSLEPLSDAIEEKTLRFIDDFYSVISDPVQVQDKILVNCAQ